MRPQGQLLSWNRAPGRAYSATSWKATATVFRQRQVERKGPSCPLKHWSKKKKKSGKTKISCQRRGGTAKKKKRKHKDGAIRKPPKRAGGEKKRRPGVRTVEIQWSQTAVKGKNWGKKTLSQGETPGRHSRKTQNGNSHRLGGARGSKKGKTPYNHPRNP